jgi:hypothetical protein
MSVRYEMRRLGDGWTVWDAEKNGVTIIERQWLMSVPEQDAIEITHSLNLRDQRERARLAVTDLFSRRRANIR